MRSCAEDMTADHRCALAQHVERVAKAICIEPRLRRAERVPAGAVAISMGLDRTSGLDVPAGEIRDASQDAAYALHTQEASPCERTAWRMSARSA